MERLLSPAAVIRITRKTILRRTGPGQKPTYTFAKGMSLLKLLRLKRALPLFRVDEPPFLVDLVTLEPEQN